MKCHEMLMSRISDSKNNPTLEGRPRLKEACQQLQQMALQLGDGAKLPTMIELRSQLGMSLSTINDAVRELERHGMLRSVNGVGIYVAKTINRKATGKLGLWFRSRPLADHYMTDLMSGIRNEAARYNWDVILLNENEETVESGKVDAVLMFCHVTEALLINLPPEVPHALLFQHSPEFTCIAADDFEGQKLATQHLLQQGHRRISYLPSSDNDSISRQRLAGYEAAYKEAGIVFEEKWVRFLHKPRIKNYRVAGESVMTSWLNDGWNDLGCTAILAANDTAAIGIIQALKAKGLRVPEDVSVMGFDGTEISDLCTPRLTTIKVPLAEIGARAVKVLLQQVDEETSLLEKIVLPVQLKLGESTASGKIREVNETSFI